MTGFLLADGSIGLWLDTVFANFDYSIFAFFGGIQNSVLTWIAKVFTSMGSEIYVVLFAILGLVLCFFRKTRKAGFAIVFAIIIGTVITNVIAKPMVLRIRPYNTLQNDAQFWSWYVGAGMLSESDYCFPSGHTNAAMEIAVALCLCFATSKNKKARALCWIFPVVAIIVGCSRVYLMVHYATDVLAGYICGIVAGVLGFFLGKLVCLPFRKKDAKAGKLRGGAIAAIVSAWLVILLISFIMTIRSGGQDAVRCSYDGDYDCQNEAETGSKYPAINGEYYCKIHWKEIMEDGK